VGQYRRFLASNFQVLGLRSSSKPPISKKGVSKGNLIKISNFLFSKLPIPRVGTSKSLGCQISTKGMGTPGVRLDNDRHIT